MSVPVQLEMEEGAPSLSRPLQEFTKYFWGISVGLLELGEESVEMRRVNALNTRRYAVVTAEESNRILNLAHRSWGTADQDSGGPGERGSGTRSEFRRERIVNAVSLRKKSMDHLLRGAAVAGGGVVPMLSALGIYDVVGLMVAARTREIAVRGALGASRPHPPICTMPTAWDNGVAARFMPKRYTSRELVKLAEEFGWILVGVRGDHHNFKHPAAGS